MKYIAGFIGVGNMGGALLNAVSKTCENIAVFDVNDALASEKAKIYSADFCTMKQLSENSKYVFLGVKPNIIPVVADQIKEYINDETVIVTMAAGVSVESLASVIGNDKIIRIMPNTPVSVGEGMILYCTGASVSEEDEKGFVDLMCKAGQLDKIDEKMIDAAAALSGCGPAFVYMFIDALADGAVKCGLPRDKALLYAKQTVYGSAFYSMNSDKHPDKLKDEVCSPGGTTIEGVFALEKGAFRHTASSAVVAAYEKTKLL